MTQDYLGVEIDIGGVGDYMAKVDAKIRRIKEVHRAVKRGLAWELPGLFVKDIVAYAVSHINLHCTMVLSENVAPKVASTAIPVYYHKDVKQPMVVRTTPQGHAWQHVSHSH
jgi:hypothetical protein